MCLILFAYRQHPDYPFILAANRDEFFQRPTRPAQFWPDNPQLLAGKDLEAGGTWLGITRQGRFAAITNFREGSGESSSLATPLSRGRLTLDYLTGKEAAEAYLNQVHTQRDAFPGFNLLVGDSHQLYYYSNRQQNSRQRRPEALPPGIYGLSNHLLNTPWPKVAAGRDHLHQAINQLPDTTQLLALLQNPNRAPDHLLPDTGIDLDWERLLSSAFIDSPDYGTRASTLLTIDSHGRVRFSEQTYTKPNPEAPAQAAAPAQLFEFRLAKGEGGAKAE